MMRRLLFLVRHLGPREGLALWWRQLADRPATPRAAWSASHGERPSMPGYRRGTRR